MQAEGTKTLPDEHTPILKRAAVYATRVFLALRVGTLAWVLLISLVGGRMIVEPEALCRNSALLENNAGLGTGLNAWLRWDTICYLLIAETGYAVHPGLTVWPPLYPLLIRLFSLFGLPPLLAALIISSLATWLAFFLLYILVTESHNETTAKNTLFLYAIYPSAFFLVAAYTESLFLALAVGSLLLARRKAWGWAGILAALATLTRNQGIILSLVLFWEGILRYREGDGLSSRDLFRMLFASCLPALTFGAYALYIRFGLNSDWPWQTLGVWWGQSSGFPWQGLLGNVKQLLTLPISQDLYWLPTTLLDLILAILIPIVLILHRRSNRSTYMLFAWLLFLSASVKLGPEDTLVSFSRYMIAAFPFFVALAPAIEKPYLRVTVFAICLTFQAILLSMFYIWSWAG
jgi:hypothetical protein